MSTTKHEKQDIKKKQGYEKLIVYLLANYQGGFFLNFMGIGKLKYMELRKDVEELFDVEQVRQTPVQSHLRGTQNIITGKDAESGWNVFICPTTSLYAIKLQKYREELLEKEQVEGIITLEKGFCGILTPMSIIVLGAQRPKLIWLTSAKTIDDVIHVISDISTYEGNVYYTPKLDSKNIMPEYYNDAQKQVEEVRNKFGAQKVMKLVDVAEIILGKSVKQDEFDTNGIYYLRARDIQADVICNPDVYVSESLGEKYAKQLLQEGDILLSKNFGQHKMAIVSSNNLPAMASNGLFIIRPFGVPEKYLFQYMTSNTGREILDKQLTRIETGATITTINLMDLKEIEVPVFDEQTMFDFLRIDKMEMKDIVQMLSNAVFSNSISDLRLFESELEKRLYNDLLGAGWREDEVRMNDAECTIQLHSAMFRPDIVLKNGKDWLGIMEIKPNFSCMSIHWVRHIQEIIMRKKVPFLILSTGLYHEIHSTFTSSVKKLDKVPSKEMLLSLLKEKEGN